jgi:hypothetical protein
MSPLKPMAPPAVQHRCKKSAGSLLEADNVFSIAKKHALLFS